MNSNKNELLDFDELIQVCNEQLHKIKNEKRGQIIAVLSSNKNVYNSVIKNVCNSFESEIINQLSDNNDTIIEKIVCVWSDGCIDLPSYKFREKLCEINSNNRDAKILLKGKESLGWKTIEQTL